jgi:UDP-glucose 4-epimerase
MDVARGHVLALDWMLDCHGAEAPRNGVNCEVPRNDVNCEAPRNDVNCEEPFNDTVIASEAKQSSDGTGSKAINLGTGKGTSVKELIAAFERVCGRTLPTVIDGRRAGDLGSVYADVSLAGDLLGFKAEYGIDDICADAWKWQRYSINLDGE